MNSIIMDSWRVTTAANETFLVIPDGCRDLILKILPDQKPYWFISPLQSQTNYLFSQAGVYSGGSRLQPGTVIDEHALMPALNHQQHHEADLAALIAQCCHRPAAVSEILQALANEGNTVTKAAAQLGVHPRTLQRKLLKLTGTSPNFWLMLARARKAARMLSQPLPLCEIAYLNGFSDQSHMTREFLRWFNITPAKLKPESAQYQQLQQLGYC
ncbi:MAG: helix-turn-helix transcriptional regulator [Pseudomonadales bacterium]|nr:helix-turn-helix transcriptional regulator [Pseudomonadales bacterium]NRA16128.1 helix-turn-helix transcriptional regulator [Oceanospirillaceae bacterium]